MDKARILLIIIGLSTLAVGLFSFHMREEMVLFYSSVEHGGDVCITRHYLTTTNATQGTVPVPAGATGWFVVDDCSGPTFRAKTTQN